jgi:hypothetical protein
MNFDTTVRLAIMDSFLAEVGPSVPVVARMLDAPADDVAAAFDRLAAGRAIVLQPGTHDILMSAPFAGVRTEFSVHVGDRWYSANCVWDAVGIPAMLAGAGRRANARIETRCADCSASLSLDVRDGELTAKPPEAVAHFAVPATRWWADIVFT